MKIGMCHGNASIKEDNNDILIKIYLPIIEGETIESNEPHIQ
jgi:hypothetical protein